MRHYPPALHALLKEAKKHLAPVLNEASLEAVYGLCVAMDYVQDGDGQYQARAPRLSSRLARLPPATPATHDTRATRAPRLLRASSAGREGQ